MTVVTSRFHSLPPAAGSFECNRLLTTVATAPDSGASRRTVSRECFRRGCEAVFDCDRLLSGMQRFVALVSDPCRCEARNYVRAKWLHSDDHLSLSRLGQARHVTFAQPGPVIVRLTWCEK